MARHLSVLGHVAALVVATAGCLVLISCGSSVKPCTTTSVESTSLQITLPITPSIGQGDTVSSPVPAALRGYLGRPLVLAFWKSN